jgi:rare lipoprotein A
MISGIAMLPAQTRKAAGDATYYGHSFHGRRTSDGSVYHRDSLTCAHRTLPFGTLLKVRNKNNGREVVVKVTDRGPFRRGGIVDLSYAAAKEIGMVGSGVVPVEVETVPAGTAAQQNGVKGSPQLPELQFLDPADGNYYSLTEWLKRGKEERERAKVQAALQQHANNMAAEMSKATWRVLNDQLTAKADNKNKK